MSGKMSSVTQPESNRFAQVKTMIELLNHLNFQEVKVILEALDIASDFSDRNIKRRHDLETNSD